MNIADASVLIAHLDEKDRHHGHASELLLELAERPLGASPITVAEVLVGPARARRLEAALAALRDLALQEVSLGSDASARLAVLRAETGLRLPDCCVLLAADEAGAESIASFDAKLASSARRLGRTVRSGPSRGRLPSSQ